jgi:hypothetical protein
MAAVFSGYETLSSDARAAIRRARRVVAAAALALIAAATASGTVILDRVRIENSRQALTFLRGKLRPGDTSGGMGLQSVLDKASNVRLDTTFSPLFQIEMRTFDGSAPAVRVPSAEIDFTLLPLEQTTLERNPLVPNSARLTWTDVPVPGSTQLLQVVIEVSLRATDGKAVWNIWTWLAGEGPYAIYAVRFPFFAMRAIRDDASDDAFLLPITGGQVVPSPLVRGNDLSERAADEDSTNDSLFTYPGSVMSQFMAYYDPSMGFYVQAEDVAGTTKNLYFDVASPRLNPGTTRLYTYVTHFNTAPAPANGESLAQIRDSLTYFALRDLLGYSVTTDVFHGDWLDAAHEYRDWVLSSGAPWVSRGPLATRTDTAFPVRDTAYALRWQFSSTPGPIDPATESASMEDTLGFYENVRRLYDPDSVEEFVPLAVISQAQTRFDGTVIGVGQGDDVAEPLRDGVPEFLHDVQHPAAGGFPIRAVALNRDTSGIDILSPNAALALRNGVMRKSDLSPASGPIGDIDVFRSCLGSSWLLDRRTQILTQTVLDSFHLGEPGFTMAAVTGTGNFAYECFAPMQDDPSIVDRSQHLHDVGGGHYLQDGWLRLAANMNAFATSLGLPFFLLGMEHTPETLLDEYILVGRSLSDPLDDTQTGVARTIGGARAVPLFTALYHDYDVQPANVPFTADIVQRYVDDAHPLADNLLSRFRMAQLAMQGRLLKYRIARDEDEEWDGPPSTLPLEVQDEHAYFAALATLRVVADPFLVFGLALRDPVIDPETAADTTPIRFILRGHETIVDEPSLLGSAWLDAATGDVGLVFTNYTMRAAQCSFEIRPADCSLAPGVTYKLQQGSVDGTWTDIPGAIVDGSLESATLGPIAVPAMEDLAGPPWAIFRIVPM